MTTEMFYQELLGLQAPWRVVRVVFDKGLGQVDVWLEHEPGVVWSCPRCGRSCGLSGHAEERTWRHLNTCEYATLVHARLPRVNCPEHVGAQVPAPWAEGNTRFTLAMECHGIDVLKECDLTGAGRLTSLSWDELWGILDRAVTRGAARKEKRLPEYIGVDEKSFAKRHRYETLVINLQEGTVEHVANTRRSACLREYFSSFTREERQGVKAIAMDMWEPYISQAKTWLPGSDEKVVFDRFHVMSQATKAVDTIRRQEHKVLAKEGDNRLKGTRYLWLWSEENLPEKRREAFAKLKGQDLKVGRAWSIKENLRRLWEHTKLPEARKHFARWYFWATHSRLQPMIKAARTLKKYLWGVLNYFRHPITNACAEGINSKIETIKKMACGFRNREHFRQAIYFHCGGLNLYPSVAGA